MLDQKKSYGGAKMIFSAVLVFGVMIFIFLLVAISGFYPRRTIKGKFDKTIIYLFAEYSYKLDKLDMLIKKLNSENVQTIRVPLSVTWAGAIRHQREKISNIVTMFSGLYAAIIFMEPITGFSPLKKCSSSMLLMIIFSPLILVIFAYYFRSVASDFSYLEEKYIQTANNIKENYFNDENINPAKVKVLDQVYNEIKLDLDIYKTNVGFGGIVLLAISALLTFSDKIPASVPKDLGISLMMVITLTMLFKMIYENYRSRVIYISINAVNRLKATLTE